MCGRAQMNDLGTVEILQVLQASVLTGKGAWAGLGSRCVF